jgi:hypothetical protein
MSWVIGRKGQKVVIAFGGDDGTLDTVIGYSALLIDARHMARRARRMIKAIERREQQAEKAGI